MPEMIAMKSHVVTWKGVKETQLDWAALFSVHIHSGKMVIVTIRFLQSPSVIQQHLFSNGWLTHTVSWFRECIVVSLSSPYRVQSIQVFKAMRPCWRSIPVTYLWVARLEVTVSTRFGFEVAIAILSHSILQCFVVWQWRYSACFCQSQTVTLACVTALASRASCRR